MSGARVNLGGAIPADVCAHCGNALTESGRSHAEGRNRGLQRCAPEETGRPYGLAAHPKGTPHPLNCHLYVEAGARALGDHARERAALDSLALDDRARGRS